MSEHTDAVELYWIPVAAGTSRAQQWSLRCWEALAAILARRKPSRLFHPALKFCLEDGATYTMELTPAFDAETASPLMTGPVGVRGAGRFRLFRYQLRCYQAAALPDEQWAVDSPVLLTGGYLVGRQLVGLGMAVPPYTWGRRVAGTSEMWTSASVIAWVLLRAGIAAEKIALPAGGHAPGWQAGLEVAWKSAVRTPTGP